MSEAEALQMAIDAVLVIQDGLAKMMAGVAGIEATMADHETRIAALEADLSRHHVNGAG